MCTKPGGGAAARAGCTRVGCSLGSPRPSSSSSLLLLLLLLLLSLLLLL